MSEETTRQLPDDALRQILTRFDSLETRLTALEEKVETRLKKVEDEIFMLRRKFDVWTGDLALIQQR
jgi:hypothetical protein